MCDPTKAARVKEFTGHLVKSPVGGPVFSVENGRACSDITSVKHRQATQKPQLIMISNIYLNNPHTPRSKSFDDQSSNITF
jgi:hypothetical protein